MPHEGKGPDMMMAPPADGAEAGVGLGAGGSSKLAGPQRRLLAARSCSCGPAAVEAAAAEAPGAPDPAATPHPRLKKFAE